MKTVAKIFVVLSAVVSGLFAAGCSAPTSDKPVLLDAVNITLNAAIVFLASPTCPAAAGQSMLTLLKGSAPASKSAQFYLDEQNPAALRHKQLPDLRLTVCVKSRERPSPAMDIACMANKTRCAQYQQWLDDKYPAKQIFVTPT